MESICPFESQYMIRETSDNMLHTTIPGYSNFGLYHWKEIINETHTKHSRWLNEQNIQCLSSAQA